MNSAVLSRWRIIILFLLVLLLAPWVISNSKTDAIGSVDFMQYWSSASLLREGENPYDRTLLESYQKEHWKEGASVLPVIMYNPPFIFFFTLPFSFLSFFSAVWCWMLGIAATLFFSIVILLQGKRSGNFIKYHVLLLLMVISSPPFLTLLFYGQSSHLLVLSLAAFLYYLPTRSLAATLPGGMCLGLSVIKPHAFYLLYLFIAVQSLLKRSWQTILGMMITVAFLAVVPLLFQPQIWSYYGEFSKSPPLSWMTPTLGSWLQFGVLAKASGSDALLLRFLPTILIGLASIVFMVRSDLESESQRLRALLICVVVSLISSPYGWVYDQSVLLLFFALLVPYCSWEVFYRTAAAILSIHLIAACIPGELGQHYALWYPPVIGAIVWFALKQEDTSKRRSE